MFKYPEEIRRIIYTTNALENFNRQPHKVTKSAFVSDGALLKQLYLIIMQVIEKWTMPLRDWGNILMCLMVNFGDRINRSLVLRGQGNPHGPPEACGQSCCSFQTHSRQ